MASKLKMEKMVKYVVENKLRELRLAVVAQFRSDFMRT